MNILKRATLSIKRRLVKSITFLLLIVLLGTLTAGSITVRQAIKNTDANLRRRMPAIVTVVPFVDDEENQRIYDEIGEWPESHLNILTPELIREVATLPYIKFFDYAIDIGHWSVTSNDLEPWMDEVVPWPLWNYDEERGAFIRPRGVSSPEFIEARDGLIKLIEGRTFTEEELASRTEVTPVLISTELARINHLHIGSTFDSRLAIERSNVEQDEERFVVDETFPMKVIGIFEPSVPEFVMEDEDAFSTLNQIGAAYHRVYIPNKVAEVMFDLRVYGDAIFHNDDWKPELYVDNMFVLDDPMYQPDFTQAIANLEGNWEVQDLSSGFAEISTSMAAMGELADFVLLGSVGAMVLVIGLVVLLFLRDRKHEIGVYLAMGDQKKNIILQIVIELLPLALIGLTISLLVGHLMAAGLSQEMLRQDLLSEMNTSAHHEQYQPLENLGYTFEISTEEMLATYEISLEPTTILIFYSIGLGTVLISTLIPIIFTVIVDPKKLLLENTI